MQTWAKRGVQAALVTGGMLAVGSGVADACTERPVPPLGEALPDDLLGSGSLSRADHPVTALAGTLDPVRDLLPEVENELTRELPVLRDQPRHRAEPLQLAGWVADTADAHAPGGPAPAESSVVLGLRPVPGAHGPLGTPSEGFHRSLSWAGPIGDVIKGGADALDKGAFPAGHRQDVAAELVRPAADPAHFDGFARNAAGIVDLWHDTLERGRGLLAPDSVDLTSGELPGTHGDLVSVPEAVLRGALSAVHAAPTPRDVPPLAVPGEHQDKVHEIPNLKGLPTGRAGDPGVHAPLPLGGQLSALGGGHTQAPVVNELTSAISPRFSSAPLNSDVLVKVADELDAAVPEHRLVARSPFRPEPAPRASTGMALPILDGGVPEINAVQGQTLPTGELRPADLLDRTMPLTRI
ncbi:hypothetical protein [Saccharopolyspora rosea]|uniref:Secreted protein n=1 Tax=Saccharopolyspora rosea TaxID=524884 RepID=A0ABW3FN18_9PSEU|nr:hypothetical protein [Saccharopolyspora rosea]